MKPPRGALPGLALLALLGLACSADPVIYEHNGFAMGTLAELKVVTWDSQDAQAALAAGLSELSRLERMTTSYSDSSEVALFAQGAGGDALPLPDDLDRILTTARLVAEESSGAFDPTAGPLVSLWGFPDATSRPDSASVARAVERVGWARCVRGDAGWSLAVGMEVDLGGIAKGYAVDRVADRLAESGEGCLVSVGGDLAVRGARPGRSGWTIGVQDPREPSRLLLKLRLSGALAVATSGDYQQYFEEDGERWHHILDPRTGWPARGLRSVTVVGPTCELADAWATAAFVLGPVDGLAALEAHPDLEGVLVEEDADGELVLHRTSRMAAIEVGG